MARKSICGMVLAGLLAAGGVHADPTLPDDIGKKAGEHKGKGNDPFKQAGVRSEPPAPSVPPALAKATGDAERYVGVIPSTQAAYNACPTGNRVMMYLDDEDTQWGSFHSEYMSYWGPHDGPYGLVDGNGDNTRMNYCKVPGANLRPLNGPEELDYIVLRLDGACPVGGLPFSYYLDNEDDGNNNSNSGNIYPCAQSTSGTRLEFCFFPAAGSGGIQALPDLAYVGGDYAYYARMNSRGHVLPARLQIHNEDTDNRNSTDWKGMSAANQTRVKRIMNNSISTTFYVARKLGAQ
jgi:hypothetical protein